MTRLSGLNQEITSSDKEYGFSSSSNTFREQYLNNSDSLTIEEGIDKFISEIKKGEKELDEIIDDFFESLGEDPFSKILPASGTIGEKAKVLFDFFYEKIIKRISEDDQIKGMDKIRIFENLFEVFVGDMEYMDPSLNQQEMDDVRYASREPCKKTFERIMDQFGLLTTCPERLEAFKTIINLFPSLSEGEKKTLKEFGFIEDFNNALRNAADTTWRYLTTDEERTEFLKFVFQKEEIKYLSDATLSQAVNFITELKMDPAAEFNAISLILELMTHYPDLMKINNILSSVLAPYEEKYRYKVINAENPATFSDEQWKRIAILKDFQMNILKHAITERGDNRAVEEIIKATKGITFFSLNYNEIEDVTTKDFITAYIIAFRYIEDDLKKDLNSLVSIRALSLINDHLKGMLANLNNKDLCEVSRQYYETISSILLKILINGADKFEDSFIRDWSNPPIKKTENTDDSTKISAKYYFDNSLKELVTNESFEIASLILDLPEDDNLRKTLLMVVRTNREIFLESLKNNANVSQKNLSMIQEIINREK